MAGLRLIIHDGILSDLIWAADIGFDEAGYVVDNPDIIIDPSDIHSSGIQYATYSPFNSGAYGPGVAGGQFGGHFQTYKKQGWDIIAGDGISGDIVRTCMNHMHWCNYGCGNGCDVYSDPFNHPIKGPNTFHVDYIDAVFDDVLWFQPAIDAMARAVEVGTCAEVGIRINLNSELYLPDIWQAIISTARSQGIPCNNVCFYGDKDTDVISILKTDANDILLGLIQTFGTRNGIGE